MQKTTQEIEEQFTKRRVEGIRGSQDRTNYEIIAWAMTEGLKENKIWWFAYELMGFHVIDGKRYFLSYETSARLSEMSKAGSVESRPSDGRLYLFRILSQDERKAKDTLF